ncbi:MAG: acyl-ACP--UDP-N-acetylglucosamine O-acyltransferase [Fimbriimonas sp.]|nr:acyl-ACP--UDP-N-acetylglucosamine O-acyltransferase [Fimbriimonas sp.]
MAKIHPLSNVDSGAEIADDVVIGPFCNVETGTFIGAGCRLDSHVTIKQGTSLGVNNFMGQGVVLGGDPQDRKYRGEPTYLRVGNDNTFREYVTVHRATGEGLATVIGNDNFLMANVHLGHNVTLHDHITIANSTGISGHVTVEDLVTMGGMTGVHQFVRIGKVAMVGGCMRIVTDVPPFMLVGGIDEEIRDINAIGLRRFGITPQSRLALHKACKLLFKSQLGLSNAIEIVRREVPMTAEVEELLHFEERRKSGKNGRQDQP